MTDFHKSLPDAEVYVYDNNSTDETASLAKSPGAFVRTETRQGKGNVIRSMFNDIDADVYIMVDRDDTYPAKVVPKMVSKMFGGYDVVIGHR